MGSWLVGWLPSWLGGAIGLAFVLVLASIPWSRVRRTPPAIRAHREWLIAAGPSVIGIAVTAACDYWFGRHNVYVKDFGSSFLGPIWDVVISLPFWLISVFVLIRRLTYPAALVATLGLGTLTVMAFDSVSTSHSSTAVLGYLVPWFYGIPLIFLTFVADETFLAARRGWRTRRSLA